MYKRVLTKRAFKGETLSVYKDRYLIDYEIVELEYMRVPMVALMVARTKNGKFVFVQQFRQALNGSSIEFPAGKINNSEMPHLAARREAYEEAGIYTKKIIKLGEIYSSPEFSNEKVYVYLTTEFKELPPSPEIYEKLKVFKLSMKEVEAGIKSGKIRDGKTIAAYYMYLHYKKLKP